MPLYISADMALPDQGEWVNRFNVPSNSSDRLYVVSQHRTKRHWGCGCQAWRMRRACKHLTSLGLPSNEKPYEIQIVRQQAQRARLGPLEQANAQRARLGLPLLADGYVAPRGRNARDTERTKPRRTAAEPQPETEPAPPPKPKRLYKL